MCLILRNVSLEPHPVCDTPGIEIPTLVVVKGDPDPKIRPGWYPSTSLQRVHSHVEMSSTGRPPPSRRERSLSTVLTSPCIPAPGVTSLSSYPLASSSMNNIETKSKRRSISTGGGHLSVSPPSKTLKSDIIRTSEDTGSSSPNVCLSPGGVGLSEKPPVGFYTVAGSSRLRDREFRLGKSGVHVRFSSMDDRIIPKGSNNTSMADLQQLPSRCHHLAAAAAQKAVEEGAVVADPSSSQQQQRILFTPVPPQTVQRTQSNPEMECCPVCLARKECEILLKRTYSKVISRGLTFLWLKVHCDNPLMEPFK